MKKNTLKGLVFVAATSALLASCDLMKDVEYKVTPNPLEMHGDSVRVNVEVTLPPKGIKKKASAEITPMLGNTALKPVTILGEKATGNGNTIMYKPGGKVTYTDVVPYKPEYEVTDLNVTGKIMKGGNEKEKIEPYKIADGTIITPLLVKKDYRVILETDNFQRVTEKTFKAQINFDKAKADLRKNELKEKDIIELQAFLNAAETNPKIAIKSINLIGFASPEGEEGRNGSLSSERAGTAKTAAMEIAKKAKNTKAQTEIYNISGKGEDFDGFKAELEKSSMSAEDKALILRILEMYKDPVEREKQMKALGKTFTQLDKSIFPLLRRAEIQIVYDLTGYSDEELVAISKTNPEKLTVEELLFTATLTDDWNEKLRLYQEASNLFPLDVRCHNNTGAALYMLNNLTDAGFKFEAANSLQDNKISKNNLGAIAGMQGNRSKAKQLFTQASGAGSEVNYNMGILSIMEGKYADAVSKLGSDNTFNKALAQLLNGNPDSAIKTVDGSKDKETALGYYLKAIASARMDKVDALVSNLKNAFSKDGSFKAKAAKDREFLKYKDNPSFSGIVQ